jgi:hypothetical protein
MESETVGELGSTHGEDLISVHLKTVMSTIDFTAPELLEWKLRIDLENLVEAHDLQKEEIAEDKIEGLESDLESAVQVAYNRGAVQWAKDNYPTWIDRLEANKKAGEARTQC